MTNGQRLSIDESLLPTSNSKSDSQKYSPRIDQVVSLNFSLAKVVAIFTVVAGHWFAGTILWIPVTFGLFIFSFSSAYFTAKLYGANFDQQDFWRKKLSRLGLRFWVIMSFLTVFLFFQGKTVIDWHTIIHYIGLSGVLNWFSIQNDSALGAGLWFFTLLLIFYIIYPYIAKLCESKFFALLFAIAAIIATLYLESEIKVGHELWLTALGFVLGVGYGLHQPKFKPWIAFSLAALSCICLLGLNIFSTYKQFNNFLIAFASISISLWLSRVQIPQWCIAKRFAKLEKYLLEIFLIHTYLFFRVSGNFVLDFFVSFLLIALSAIAINHISEWLSSLIFDRPKILA